MKWVSLGNIKYNARKSNSRVFPLRITKKHFNSLKDLATKTHDIKNITRRDVLRQNGRPYTAWVPKLGFGKKGIKKKKFLRVSKP